MLCLKPNRQTKKSRADARELPRSIAHVSVSHRLGMRNETFYTAERFREGENAQLLDQPRHCVSAADQLETEHRAKTLLLARRQPMVGMRCETWVVNREYAGMTLKHLGNHHGADLLLMEPWI